ncbi:MAG: NUDIX hydrolase [Candidatus Thermofonsia bacterium]|nr:MAG: NUDIX hydrolase [Candidatus Thermofonsia bacterium]
MESMVKKWPKLDSQTLGDYRIFTIRQDTRQSPRTGKIHTFFVLDTTDWINVIPLTANNEVVMIHQFRHGTGDVTLEIPGGMVDPNEDPADSARRELLEETGYTCDDIIPIGVVHPNPAFLSNRCHTFLATNARWQQPPHFDGAEDIAVELFPLSDVPELIRNGRISHALVVAAFSHLDRYQQDNNR